MSAESFRTPAEIVVHAATATIVVALLIAVGQPIFTDDLWWHLAIGAHYVANGPWLDADPFLFGAAGPPDPAAWLTDVFFHGVHRVGGFQALRALHVVWVAATLAFGWSMLRRISGSKLFASLGASCFAILGAYRFFQLRPHLFTILAALVLIRLLVVDRRPPTPGRMLAAGLLLCVWANTHGAFVLGPVLIGAAIAGALFGAVAWAPEDPLGWLRVRRLAVAGVVGLAATLINPVGPRFLTLFFAAGASTPELQVVADEWTPVALFARPLLNVPPTPLVYLIVWILLIATPVVAGLLFRARSRATDRAALVGAIDPALWAVAAASLIGMVSAVRLLWLGFFAVLAIGQAARVVSLTAGRRALLARAAAAACSVALIPCFFALGDWSMISQALDRTTYAQPYSTAKYNAHGVWFLRDSGLEGRVYNDYWIGNFLSYWLPPDLQMFVNGSLNIPRSMMEAGQNIRARRVDASGRTTEALLDLYGVDLFFGTGVPVVPARGRPAPDTTHHLEGAPGWLPIFRNMQTTIHLRANARNRENLERVATYYRSKGVPFDPLVGFDPARVIREAPGWSIAHGLIPDDMAGLVDQARLESTTGRRVGARDRLASLYVLIGLYDDALAIDARLVEAIERPVAAARRQVWALLHARRVEDLRAAADRLDRIARPHDALSHRLVAVSHRFEAMSEDERAEVLATLPLFTRPQGQWVTSGFIAAQSRPGRE